MSYLSEDLKAKIDALKARQLPPEEELRQVTSLGKYIANLPTRYRVFTAGTAHLPKHTVPAYLLYIEEKGTFVLTWGEDGPVEHTPHVFRPSGNLMSSLREVYLHPEMDSSTVSYGTHVVPSGGIGKADATD